MKWTITENEECECPGFTVDLLPKQIPANLHVLYKESQIYLQADGLAGIIPCASNNSILIEPKCKSLQPFAMYEYINDLTLHQSNKNGIDWDRNNVDFQSIARKFANELITIQCHQRLFKRLPIKKSRAVIKGKVDWPNTARRILSGQIEPVISTALESTYDIPENEVISMAAKRCLPLFEHNTDEWGVLYSWASMSYKKVLTKESLLRLKGNLRNLQIGGAHAYYYTPIALALVILGIDEAGNTSANNQSILFNMPGLYEDYIRTAFMRKSAPKGYSCQKSFIPRSFLFSNGSCELEPDITIYDGNNVLAVLDVKYKVPDSKDYYQIFTYMKYANLSKAFVISPYVRHNETISAYDGSRIIGINISTSVHLSLEEIASDIIENL